MKWVLVFIVFMGCGVEHAEQYNNDAGLNFYEDSGYETEAFEIELYHGCCKICVNGKACGDTCINKEINCYSLEGCACDSIN